MATYLGSNDSGAAGSMYRRQPFTYIGQTKMSSPFKLNYDTTMASSPQSTAPNVGTYTLPDNPQSIPTAGQNLNMEGVFGDFEKRYMYGSDILVPKTATEGQVYQDSNNNKYTYTNGTWVKWQTPTVTGTTTEMQGQQTAGWNSALEIAVPIGTMAPIQINGITNGQGWQLDQLLEYGNAHPDKQVEILAGIRAKIKWNRDRASDKKYWDNVLNNFDKASATVSAYSDALKYYTGPVDITDPTAQMKDVMGKISKNELKLTNEDGMLDTTDLRAQGGYGIWMADMLETSYKTGNLQADFYQTDEQGNVIKDENNKPMYVPELQTMINYITNGTPEDQKKWQQYRRDVAGYALAQGQTVNSGYYQDALASDIANRAAQASSQISATITKEISDQYEYITNSLGNALVEMGYLTSKEGFANKMATDYAKIEEAYREGIEELAMQVGEAEAARRGDIFAGILGGLANVMLGFFA